MKIKPGVDSIDTIPLWIKLTNVPDAYWTEEGLSRLASVVGKPIGADALTAKLDLLPFAKLQVQYKLGNPLPNEVSAAVLDPETEVKSFVKVSITYPFRPLFCSGCKSLGHTVGACPKVSRIWVKKDTQGAGKNDIGFVGTDIGHIPSTQEAQPPDAQAVNDCHVNVTTVGSNEDSWTEVKRKKSSTTDSEVSPSPPRTFKNLRIVDEVDKRKVNMNGSSPVRLTKSQKKKLRLQQGSTPPPNP